MRKDVTFLGVTIMSGYSIYQTVTAHYRMAAMQEFSMPILWKYQKWCKPFNSTFLKESMRNLDLRCVSFILWLFFNRNNVSYEGHFVWSEGLQRFLCKCCLATWQLSGWSNYEIRKNMNSWKIIKKSQSSNHVHLLLTPRVRLVRPTFASTCCENATSQ